MFNDQKSLEIFFSLNQIILFLLKWNETWNQCLEFESKIGTLYLMKRKKRLKTPWAT